MDLKTRVTKLEQAAGIGTHQSWFDLETWKRENDLTAGNVMPLAEQERRRLAEYPDQADAIRAHFAQTRANLERAAATLGPLEVGL